MNSKPTNPFGEVDDETLNQLQVDFEDWSKREKSSNLEDYIRECGISENIAQRVRERITLERDLFPENPDQLSSNSISEFDLTGTELGDFRLLRKIGQGGMGTVWLAQQQKRVQRQVAIKLIKPGFDSEDFVRRFSVERQALAVMSHPNIARVLDAGLTPTGRPYFVMEYISGISIVKYCEQNRLSVVKRLKLFLQLCSAIQHAHQKGMIHRDIKPSNVLIVDVDGEPTVKVIDFGLAKAFESDGGHELPSITREPMMIGSPLWMSPEQIGGPLGLSPKRADTRSDIYSLGVVLYQLLTGTTPIRHETYVSISFSELAKQVLEEVPPAPSVRLRQLGESTARKKEGALKSLRRRWQGSPRNDLDWVVLKSLEKDPDRRYDGVATFARDVRSFLNRDPVLARRPSKTYQMRMYFSKHRFVASLAISIASLLMAGTAVSFWALRERAFAKIEADRANAVSFFFQAVVVNPGTNFAPSFLNVSFNDFMLAMVSRADHKDYTGDPQVEAMIRKSIGHIAYRMGDYKTAKTQFQRAHEVHLSVYGENNVKTLSCLRNYGSCAYELDEFPEAIVLFKKVIDLGARPNDPSEPVALEDKMRLAMAYSKDGQADKAVEIGKKASDSFMEKYGIDHRYSIRILTSMANILLNAADLNGANVIAEKLQSHLDTKRLARLPADEMNCCRCLMSVYKASGRDAKAILIARRAINIAKAEYPTSHAVAVDLTLSLVRLLKKNGNSHEALELLSNLNAETEEVLGPESPNTDQVRLDLSQLLTEHLIAPSPLPNSAVVKSLENTLRDHQVADAVELYEEYLAKAQCRLGQLYNGSNREAEAVTLLQTCLPYFEQRYGETSIEALRVMHHLVIAYRSTRSYQKAIELGNCVLALHREANLPDEEAIHFLHELSKCFFLAGEHTEAIRLSTQVLEHYRFQLGPGHIRTQDAFADLRALYLRCKQSEAVLQMQKAYTDQIVEEYGESSQVAIYEQKNYAVALQLGGRVEEATAQFVKVVDLCKKHFGESDYYSVIYVGYYQNHLMVNSKYDAAIPVIINWRESIPATSNEYYSHGTWAKISLAECHAGLDEFDKAKAIILETQEWNSTVPLRFERVATEHALRAKSILGLCLAHEGKYEEAQKKANAAFEGLRNCHACTEQPYFRWYVLRSIDRIIEIHRLAEQPNDVTKWEKQRVIVSEEQADTMPDMPIR